MNPKKMLLLASMALAAIAIAAPAGAQGAVELTKEGKALAVNAPVTAKSTNLVFTVGANSFTCEEWLLHYTVSTNSGGTVVLNPTAAHNATALNCQTHIFNPTLTFTNHITSVGFGQLTFSAAGTGSAAATVTTNTTALGLHCSYAGNIPVQATNLTDTLHIETGNVLTAPSCGNGEAHGSLTLMSEGKAVVVDIS